MTKATFCLLGTSPPCGSAVRVKSRFRRYSANCELAFAADLTGVDAFFELVPLLAAADFLGIDQDFLAALARRSARLPLSRAHLVVPFGRAAGALPGLTSWDSVISSLTLSRMGRSRRVRNHLRRCSSCRSLRGDAPGCSGRGWPTAASTGRPALVLERERCPSGNSRW